jgi:hypothetical protein
LLLERPGDCRDAEVVVASRKKNLISTSRSAFIGFFRESQPSFGHAKLSLTLTAKENLLIGTFWRKKAKSSCLPEGNDDANHDCFAEGLLPYFCAHGASFL